jgi:hypothetical protein
MEQVLQKEIRLLAKSSSGGSYNVVFTLTGDVLNCVCNCPAGQMRMNCKHKMALLIGDDSMLFDPYEKSKLVEVQEFIKQSNLLPSLSDLYNEIEKIDRKISEYESRKRKIKIKIAALLRDGVTSSSSD